VKYGIVALTKTDLIDDPEWLPLVEKEIAEKLAQTSLKDAPIIRVSSKDGSGIAQLKEEINRLALRLTARKDIGKPRLPVDRVFTMKGSGVVVTGTLVNGRLSVGDDVFIAPGGRGAHIRSIESYKQHTDTAQPGSRVALNMTGVKKDEINRGDVVMKHKVRTSRIVDVELRLIKRLDNPVKNNSELVFFLETKELLGRVIFFDKKPLGSRSPALAQVRFNQEVTTYIGERFIIRRQSPAATIGGGVILNPLADRYRARDFTETKAFLERRRSLGLEELMLTELEKNRYTEKKGFLAKSLYSAAEITEGVRRFDSQNRLVAAGPYIIDSKHWQQQMDKILKTLRQEHKAHPLKQGLSQALLYSRVDLPKDAFNQMIASLVDAGELRRMEDAVALSSHKPQASSGQEEMVALITELFEKNRSSPPTMKEITDQIPGSGEIIRFMLQQKMLIELPEGILLERGHYKDIEETIIGFLDKNGQISIQDINSLFGFSRKYSLPLLNYLDNRKITRRQGNVRVLIKR
jgi:selenocysteine-specific elongation factor